jgi:predicted aconitase with swiveling domain
METILKGRTVVKGKASGEALVTDRTISFVGGIDTETGEFIEHEHPLFRENIKGKILVYPTGKGSTGGAYILYEATSNNAGPAAIINKKIEQVTAVGAILAEIPTVDQVEPDPVMTIHTGDFVEVDATAGVIKITRARKN